MVKFAKYLYQNSIPEWKEAYCNYKSLKKSITMLKNQRSSGGRVLRRVYTLQQGAKGRSPLGPRLSADSYIKVTHKEKNYCGNRIDAVETEVLIPSSHEVVTHDVLFFAKLDQELNKVNGFYIMKETEFERHAEILDMQIQTLFELKLAEETGSLGQSWSVSWFTDPGSDDVTPMSRRPILDKSRSVQVMDAVVAQHNEMLFQTISKQGGLDALLENPQEQFEDINRVEKHSSPEYILSGTVDSEEEGRAVFDVPSVRSRRRHNIVVKALPRLRTDSTRLETSGRTNAILEEDSATVRSRIKHSETMLRDAFIEFFRGLTLLKDYRQLNHLAFTKILKKYDKATDVDASNAYMQAVDGSYFVVSEKVSFWLKWVESMFADFFMDGDRQKARNTLKPRVNKSTHGVTFFLGLFTGCALALVVGFAAVFNVLRAALNTQEREEKTEIYMRSVFPVFSMTALILLHIYMYGLDLYWWRQTRINYGFIFEFAPGTELDYRKVLLVATSLTALFGMGVVGHLTATLYHSPYTDFIPLILLLILLLILFCPFDFFYRSSRIFFLRSLLRAITPPFTRVRISDFFIGDQLCSQVPVLRNVEYCVCYYMGGWFLTRDGDKCSNNPKYLKGYYVISVLPYWWRMLQCLRRYYDEGGFRQLANAGKYLSAMIAVIAKNFYGQTGSDSWMIAYVVASSVATVYQAYWDVVLDWGLLHRRSHNKWLRDLLILENMNYVYYMSMGLNVVLRLPWVLSITRFHFGGLDPHFTDFIFAALEIVRRGHWNFYRLEYEHLYNVGRYRATKTVPLPFEHKGKM